MTHNLFMIGSDRTNAETFGLSRPGVHECSYAYCYFRTVKLTWLHTFRFGSRPLWKGFRSIFALLLRIKEPALTCIHQIA